jgi:hypothetical protein
MVTDPAPPISLSDAQLQTVMSAAKALHPDDRHSFLQADVIGD